MVSQKPQLIGESKASANQESLPLPLVIVTFQWKHHGVISA